MNTPWVVTFIKQRDCLRNQDGSPLIYTEDAAKKEVTESLNCGFAQAGETMPLPLEIFEMIR